MPSIALAPVLVLMLALSPLAALAEDANLTTNASGSAGSATRLVVAQRAYEQALSVGDTILLLAAIRLARGVSIREPTSWGKSTSGKADPKAGKGRAAAPDPAGDQAIQIVQVLAGGDPDLQDLVYDLDAQLPQGDVETAVTALSDLGGGQADSWQMPLSGSVLSEIGLIGDGDGPLSLSVTDEAGNSVCALPPVLAPALCRFTPARNGFFVVTVRNAGLVENSYRLIGN